MVKTNAAVSAALTNDHAIQTIPRATIEWNMNRVFSTICDNTPSDQDEGYDIEMFPIEAISKPLRPTKGINKARVGAGTIAEDYRLDATTNERNGRYYVADIDDSYKYWTSPYPSDAAGNITKVKPQVVYAATHITNKIVIGFENSWSSPKTFSVQIATVAAPTDAQWTTIATQASVGTAWKASGQLVLWYNGSAWVTTGRVDNADKTPKTTNIRGVRVVVTALEGGYKITDNGAVVPSNYKLYNPTLTTYNTTGFNSFFDLIEISSRLEIDASPFIIDVGDDFDMGESSNLYPIGTVTSNQAEMTLSNLYKVSGNWVPGLFNAENALSPYAPFIDANAKVNLWWEYIDEDDIALGIVNEFEMYVDEWSGQDADKVHLTMTDYSKFLNKETVRAAMWEELTFPMIVARVLDSIGFVKYNIGLDDVRVTEHVIPVYYTDGTQNAWELLSELAKATQSAIYIDGTGILQIRTRDFAMSASNAAVWTFNQKTVGNNLANIVSLEETQQFEPNHVTVSYQTTRWSAFNNGQPSMQQVWEPDADQVLRTATLKRNLLTSDPYIWVGTDDVKVWPYSGLVNIQGELVRYDGKAYVYFTGPTGAVRNTLIVNSADEAKTRNSKTPTAYQYKNYYTGALKISERGVWNSVPRDHMVDAAGYTGRLILNDSNYVSGAGGYTHLKQKSKLQVAATRSIKSDRDWLLVTRGAVADSSFYHYGTKMRFVKNAGMTSQRGGIVIHSQGSQEDGYFIELTPSRFLDGKERAIRNELIAYSRNNGKVYRFAGTGRALAIGENIDYEVDVTLTNVGSAHVLNVWVNGKNCINATISNSSPAFNARSGRFGYHIRGRSLVQHEYLYAIARQENEPPDDFSFLDKIERGYTGNQWDREWVYRWRTQRRRIKKRWVKETSRWNSQFFDEFGPYVHEVREYSVKFDPAPVLHSRIYSTNDWGAAVLEYSGSPFDAKFIIANTSRSNSVVHGEDKLSYAGTGASVNQVLTVLGRSLVIDEAQNVIAKNDDQIRRRGKMESELSSPWIQSKAMADALAAWMNANFSYGNEQVSLEVFGNPLIEVGDVVHVNYPDKYINADYFVLGVSNEFDQGLSTTLTLRRRI